LGRQLAQTYPDQVQIVAVSCPASESTSPDEVIAATQKFAANQGITLPLYVDPSLNLLRLYEPNGFPTTYLIDREGFVVHITSGYTPGDWDQLVEKLVALLQENAPAAQNDREPETPESPASLSKGVVVSAASSAEAEIPVPASAEPSVDTDVPTDTGGPAGNS
ncbi:MAG: TlpA disulfide reductase family protein, partial [Planctomycetia bacterium]|nr:TlpA disulfide reductase family protein [Planctomycetia bacterium]